MENREATVKNIRNRSLHAMHEESKCSGCSSAIKRNACTVPSFPSLHKAPKPIMHGAKDDKFKSNAAPHMRESGQSRRSWPTKNMSTNLATRIVRTNHRKRGDLLARRSIFYRNVGAAKEVISSYPVDHWSQLVHPTWISFWGKKRNRTLALLIYWSQFVYKDHVHLEKDVYDGR